MRNTTTIAILLIALGLMVFGIPVNGKFTTENFTVMDTKEIGINPVNESNGDEAKETGSSQDVNGKNATPVQSWSEQEFILPAVSAFSDSTTSKKILLLSNASTETAGYTESEPAGTLNPASYSYGQWLPAVSLTRHAEWRDNTLPPFGNGAEWISTQATQESDGDSWRLFRTGFDFPDGAVLTSAQLWFTADNTLAVYLNEDEIANAGSVFGPRPSYDPMLYRDFLTVNLSPRTGSNTLQFVVRNWVFSGYNPTGLLYKAMIEYEVPVIPNFTGRPLNGTVPLTVYFNDTSTGKPTSWNWSFGDGKFSTDRNASHTYTAAGRYNVALTASNSDWTNTTTRAGYVSVSSQGPSANFTASPTSGPARLGVQFTDTSSGNPNPNSWLWDFGDGGLSTARNPLHTYNSEGTYTVSLTVKNKKGGDTETKVGYVVVTAPPQTTFIVYAEAVSDYHGGQLPLGSAVPLAQTFYQNIIGSNNGGITWTGYGEHYNDDAGSKHWSISELSSMKADNADFAFFAGHGANDRIFFGTSNFVLELLRSDMRFGGSKAKWITLSACNVLDEDTKDNWKPVFDGLHILNSYETEGLLYDRQGGIYAARLKGGMFEGQPYQLRNIREAWRMTLEDTIDRTDYFGASMWAEPCGSDYLPGYGSFCTAPVKVNGIYDVRYSKFDCGPETSD